MATQATNWVGSLNGNTRLHDARVRGGWQRDASSGEMFLELIFTREDGETLKIRADEQSVLSALFPPPKPARSGPPRIG